jgi:3-isopropylmalate/(R)-2-methylmalate dehydratase small subunit
VWQTCGVAGFKTYTGKIAVLNQDQVDTDRIIPARFLSRVTRSGYGELLFADVREEGFPLNDSSAEGASVLVVGMNFGCGSSREHAVWAIQQAGFICVIGRKGETPGFSDIFRGNAGNCGLLLIELDSPLHSKLVEGGSGLLVTINLEEQIITFNEHTIPFEINEAIKIAALNGLDLIGTTLVFEQKISEYENNMTSFIPTREESYA